jgi:HAD superfamily hydrolase (TIGR01662 family)
LRPYLLLDAGGTVLFPNQHIIHDIVLENGYDISEEKLRLWMTRSIYYFDELLRSDGHQPHFDFYEWVLDRAGVDAQHVPALKKRLEQADAQESLWNFSYPWVRETLTRLATQGYRMSIISNADGRVEMELGKAGLRPYFQQVFDSQIVGYAKPDVRLFQHALATLALQPAECLFVGDLFYVDVLGANRAGMAAIHLDPEGLYEGWAGYHIPSIAALPAFLAQHPDLTDKGFFPLV